MSWTFSALKHLSGDWIFHHHYQQAHSELLMTLSAAEPGDVVCTVGPSRVGKSSVVTRAGQTLVGDPTHRDDNARPWLYLNANNRSGVAEFSNRTFLLQALQTCEHPYFSLPTGNALWTPKDLLRIETTSSDTALRALENALRYQRIRYVVIDEAHHFRYAKSGDKQAVAIMDFWKCVAQEHELVLCFVGAYPLLSLLRSSTHMLGRTMFVHFPRYRSNIDEDVLHFERILHFYSAHLSLPKGKTLRDWNDYLFNGSLGCIGHLRNWLKRAVLRAGLQQDSALRLQHLEQTRRTDAELESLLSEIVAGEDQFGGTPASSSSKRSTPESDTADKPKPKRKRAVRKAVRHPVRGLG